jgi:membrane associated rhomboid family serine protease
MLARTGAAAYLGAMHPIDAPAERIREPIFNVPAVVVALTVILCVIHAVMVLALSDQDVETVLELFAFNPLRYQTMLPSAEALPGGVAAAIWTFVSYAFFHANLTHLGFNLIWLVAFGTPVARRFGTWRFLLFFAFTAAAGALGHLVSHLGEDVPTIGASAAVLGMMAAAMRFVFQPGGPLGLLRLGEESTYHVPAKPLGAMLRDRRALLFVLVWFGLNALLGLPAFAMPGIEEGVAWQAHIGGFLAGLLAFAAFDPVAPSPIDAPIQDVGSTGDRPAADDQSSSLH